MVLQNRPIVTFLFVARLLDLRAVWWCEDIVTDLLWFHLTLLTICHQRHEWKLLFRNWLRALKFSLCHRTKCEDFFKPQLATHSHHSLYDPCLYCGTCSSMCSVGIWIKQVESKGLGGNAAKEFIYYLHQKKKLSIINYRTFFVPWLHE